MGFRANNVLHANHFRKDWQSRVRTWFDQPGRKLRRRQARKAKAASLGVRPLSLLRPAVRAQTVRYNRKIREGRGFTLGELKEAGIGKKEARGIGIVVDHRRRNLSEEGKAVNVERLKAYKTRLIVFPRNSKKPKKADSTVRNICVVTVWLVYNTRYRVPTLLLLPPAHLFPSLPPSFLRLPARSPLRSVSSRPTAPSAMSVQLLATRASARFGKRRRPRRRRTRRSNLLAHYFFLPVPHSHHATIRTFHVHKNGHALGLIASYATCTMNMMIAFWSGTPSMHLE